MRRNLSNAQGFGQLYQSSSLADKRYSREERETYEQGQDSWLIKDLKKKELKKGHSVSVKSTRTCK